MAGSAVQYVVSEFESLLEKGTKQRFIDSINEKLSKLTGGEDYGRVLAV